VPHLKTHNTISLTQVKVHKYEEETQLQRKGVIVKGFGYLLENYLGLVVHYPTLVRVSGLAFVW
jgi:hypothetical protein